MTELKLLKPAEIEGFEQRLYPFISHIAGRSGGRYWPEHILNWAKSGEWQIWLIVDRGGIVFVGCTEIYSFATGLKCLGVRAGTGTGREQWQDRFPEVLAWAKTKGCLKWEGITRKGWRRVLCALVPSARYTHDFLEGDL